MHVEIIETKSLGNRGYLVHDGKNALAIDVQRDFERWLDVAKEYDVTITHVFETHIHNDYVTGGYKLAQQLAAEYIVPTDTDVSFDAVLAADGDTYTCGSLNVEAVHTPGHTPHHMSFAVSDNADTAVFTGGGVLYGTVGRPDLVSKDMTKPLAQAQYESAQKLKEALPESSKVYPTHGFGSFCSSSPGSGANHSTIADELQTNIAYTSKDKKQFVTAILAGLEPYPVYYKHMAGRNKAGPESLVIKQPTGLDAKKLKSFLKDDNYWVIDIRSREKYATSHPTSSVHFEYGDSFATYVGWVIPWGDKLLLAGDSAELLEEAQIQLGRIGMDEFVDQVTDDLSTYLKQVNQSTLKLARFGDIPLNATKKAVSDKITLLDTRAKSEWTASHISGSVNIPFHDVLKFHKKIENTKQVWVHCASGYRSSVAAGLLDKLGYDVVAINDNFDNVPVELLST